MTLKDRISTQGFRFGKSNFLDEFRSNPDFELVKDSVLDLEDINEIQKAILAATVDAICSECKIQKPEWIFDKSTYLESPYFAMSAKNELRIILLQESPKYFRSRNLFVSKNCMDRV